MTANDDRTAHGLRPARAASAARPRRAGRPRAPVVSRGQIADAVVDLIGERGLNGWSMRDLAGQLGVSTGTVTHYFPDKQALLIGAMDAVYVLPTGWDGGQEKSAAARLRGMAAMFVLDDPRKRRWGHFWLAYLAGAGHDARLRERQEERYERQRRFFSRLIAAGVAAGELTASLDAATEAVRLLALGNGLAMQQVATPAGLTPATARAILDAYLTNLEDDLDRCGGAG